MLPTQPSLARALAAMLVVACLPHCALGFDATVPSFDVQSDEDIAGRPDASAPDGVSDGDARLDADLPDGGDTGDGPNDAAVDADAILDADGSSDADAVSAPTVTVTAPTAGEYTVGTTLEIVWLATGSERVQLSLVHSADCSAAADGVVVPTIVSIGAAVGRYAWAVPTTVAAGSYRIRALVESDANDVVACSPVFRLVQPPGCDALGCATQNRVCETASGTPTCGDCVEGFDDADSTCVPVDCGTAPAAPSNATLASVSTTRFGGVASYTCDEGHTTTGAAGASTALTRRCGGAGAWEAASAACLPVDCGTNPVAAANARFVGVDRTTFGGTASYACNDGYRVVGASVSTYGVTCGADGTWSVGATCEAVDCGPLSPPSNGSVTTASGTRFGATATYSCAAGYALTGAATRTCDASGAWSGSAPSCVATSCGAVASVANASASVPSATTGSTATFTCQTGYTRRSGTANTQTCNGSSWSWTGTALVCDPVSCGTLSNPANGSVSTPTGVEFNDVATYSCNTGYTRSSGSATRTCQASGTWSGTAAVCSPVDCGAPPTVTNGSRTFTSTTFSSTASYSCIGGYTRAGSATLTCSASGSWGTPPTCNDTNECTSGSVCTATGNTCTNTTGSWQCSCAAGYTGTTVTGGNASCTLTLALGATCSSDSQCPSGSWCSTVSGFRRCSPRAFSGTAHQMDFIFVPSGTFQQGTPGATNNERPYTATISRNYFVSRTEVTQGQWKAATGGTNPSCFQSTSGTSCTSSNANNSGPVETVDWYSTLAYANWLSSNQGLSSCYMLTPSTCADSVSDWANGDTDCTGATFTGVTCTGYRLLTESEWERAARGGTTSTYYWGEATDTATVGLYAWFAGNAGGRTQPTGARQMNGYGLFDMSGNVWEGVWDWVYSGSASIDYPSGSATDYIGPASGAFRGIRGGGWNLDASALSSARRDNFIPFFRYNDAGFRLARTGSLALGDECSDDAHCPSNSWCSTVSGFHRCSPRLFSGAAHQMDYVFVPSGTFQQGTPGATNEERPYSATISRNYFVSRTEVTQGQWKAATGGTNPSCFQSTTGTSCTTSNANNSGPVEQVDWYSTLAYANWLSTNEGLVACYTLTPSTCADSVSDWAGGDTACTGATFTGLTCPGYRLLTESEWERAARGGTTGTYYWGDAADTATVALYAWFGPNSVGRTQSVGGKQANAYGLFDTSGHVFEWVWDWVHTGAAWINYPTGSATDYIGPAAGAIRGIRGGSWNNLASVLGSAFRRSYSPGFRLGNLVGFRLARTAN